MSRRPVCLPCAESSNDARAAGLVSTCTHGAALAHPCVAAYVTNFRIMLADKSVVICTKDENADLFHAALCGLGALGIILQLTFQLEPAYDLKHTVSLVDSVKLDEAFFRSAEHVRTIWASAGKGYLVNTFERTSEPRTKPMSPKRHVFNQLFGHFTNLIHFAAIWAPSLLSWYFRLLWPLPFNVPYQLTRRDDALYRVGPAEELLSDAVGTKHRTIELAVPLEHAQVALEELQAFIGPDFPGAAVIEIRPTAGDSFWLSQQNGRARVNFASTILMCVVHDLFIKADLD
jgi:L-gulonolactone oxidase